MDSGTPASTTSGIMALSTLRFIGAVEDEWQMYSDCESDYTIGLPIGFGASSIVYAATYQPPAQDAQVPWPFPIPCALKVLDLDALPPQSLSLLQRETRLMSLSKHPNVLRVRGSWTRGHKLYIAMRLMNKGSAADVMRYGWPGGMEEDVVRCILRQALQGLNYLHVNGFIHRDVKAANLLIDDDGTVLLGDLGVSADLSEDLPQLLPKSMSSLAPVSAAFSQPNFQAGPSDTPKRLVLFDNAIPITKRPNVGKRKSFVGTPCWMAPELIQGQQYDASADIWSFGITAIELTQGRPPKSRETPQRVLLKTIRDDPPTLDRHGSIYKYSRAFQEVVESCLAKDPSQRPTAHDLLQTPFFKSSKKKSYLVDAILRDLPPLTSRQERRILNTPQTMQSLDSWDFASTTFPLSSAVLPHRTLAGNHESWEEADGVFDMEDGIINAPAGHSSYKEVAWASKVDQSDDTSDADHPSDSYFSELGEMSSASSVPSESFHKENGVVSGHVAYPKSKLPTENAQATADSGLVFHVNLTSLPSSQISSSSSPVDIHPVPPPPRRKGLWHKVKSNVRPIPSRSRFNMESSSSTSMKQ